VRRSVLPAALVLLSVLLPAAAAPGAARAGARPVLYLVAFDHSSAARIGWLAETARRRGIRVGVLAGLRPPASAFDQTRQQWIAQALAGEIRSAYPKRTSVGSVVIGVTSGDMYIRGLSWRFAFGDRASGNVGIIATRRMNPEYYGLAHDDELFRSRLEKMFVRYLGFLVLGRPDSRDPFSVLRSSILSLDDLDLMTNQFRPPPPTAGERRWIDGSNRSCARARAATRALVAGKRIMPLPRLVRIASRVLGIRGQLLAQLRAQSGRPIGRALGRRFLRRFGLFYRRERVVLRPLRAHPGIARANVWIEMHDRANGTLRVFTLRLRLLGCASYFAQS
jgi:predicted Zn-dependent protease